MTRVDVTGGGACGALGLLASKAVLLGLLVAAGAGTGAQGQDIDLPDVVDDRYSTAVNTDSIIHHCCHQVRLFLLLVFVFVLCSQELDMFLFFPTSYININIDININSRRCSVFLLI